MITFSFLLGLVALGAWLYLTLGHKLFWLPLLVKAEAKLRRYPSVDIIVPARNESECLPECLGALLTQDYPGDWKVIVVDDHSTDGTAELARAVSEDLDKQTKLWVVQAPDLAEGWSGKVAAMNAGLNCSEAEMVLFTDADIRHNPQSLRHLVAHTEAKQLDLVSRMVKLNCESFAEKLLIPAFVFFFGMLYPFRQANNPDSRMAAAAGGTMLIRRVMLDHIGGLARIKSALIDDCSLAYAVKKAGGNIEIALTDEIDSRRPYPSIADVWRMVARTAYTQLRYSPWLLGGTLIAMAVLYIVPPSLFWGSDSPEATGLGFLAWALMSAIYMPMIRFYRLNPLWALALPMAGLIYGMATLDSARLYYAGKGGQWKGRAQANESGVASTAKETA